MLHQGSSAKALPNKRARRAARLRRFPEPYRQSVSDLTCCAPEAEDLAESFPGMLFALVSDYGSPAAREAAFLNVINGLPLKSAADALALPMWLRQLPPSAFCRPIRPVPHDKSFAHKITAHLPAGNRDAAGWLDQVLFAYHACGPVYALWIARHHRIIGGTAHLEFFQYLTAWAWHSLNPGHAAGDLIIQKWTPQIGMRRAGENIFRWRQRIAMAEVVGKGVEDTWLREAQVDGVDFVALRTIDDFFRESAAMVNCLDQYAERLASGLIRVFSLRRGPTRIANLEIGPIPRNGRLPHIVQLKGPRNQSAGRDLLPITHAWLEQQPLAKLPRRPGQVAAHTLRAAREALWLGYLQSLSETDRAIFADVLSLTPGSRSRRRARSAAALRGSR